MDLRAPSIVRRPSRPAWQDYWLARYPCNRRTTLPYPEVPITALLEAAAHRFPFRAACTLYGQATTFADIDQQARRLARSLQAHGAERGQFVGLLLPNVPEYLVALQATWLTGATVLQLSPLMVAEEIEHWLKATGCRIVITLDLLASAVLANLDGDPLEHVVLASLTGHMALWRSWLYRLERVRRGGPIRLPDDVQHHRFDHWLENKPLRRVANVFPDEDVAVLAPTGGTTASSRAVMLTHRNLVTQAFQLRDWAGGEDGSEGILGVLPLFHAYGLASGMLTSWVKGSTLHLLPRFETRSVLEILRRERVELVPAVPAMLNALNGAMRKKPLDLSFIRAVISGAAPLMPAVRAEFEGRGSSPILEGYGLTEASPVTHANPQGERNRPGTIGLPLADTDAKVVDALTGEDSLPTGAVGELAVRGPQVMKGYFNAGPETAHVLRNGWLFTGDLARRDSEGYYAIVDRKKDIIKTSGFLVYPGEVEEILRAFEGVAEAAVIGIPDLKRGELVKALIVTGKGSKVDARRLNHYCRRHLGRHKRPRQIEFVNELPKNFLGKVLRRKLRESASAMS
jgi:long-chain acyl-CoA synthetase